MGGRESRRCCVMAAGDRVDVEEELTEVSVDVNFKD